MNIFIDDNNPFLMETLSQFDFVKNINSYKGRELTQKDLIDNNIDILIARSTTQVNKKLLQNTKVKYVATVTSGIDHIDTNYLANQNIHFASALGSNSNGVAEYVVYSVLDWLINNYDTFCREQIKALKVGIIGYGNVGKKVSFYLNKLGFQININDPLIDNSNIPNYAKYKSLENIAENCDIITNHTPLTNHKQSNYPTINLINKEFLGKMKQNVCFIHSSRGNVVSELELFEKLDLSNKLNIKSKGMNLYIDVWENEPKVNEVLKTKTKISTPHIAGHTTNSKINGIKMILEDFADYIILNNFINDKNLFFKLKEKLNEKLNEVIKNKLGEEYQNLNPKFNFNEINFENLTNQEYNITLQSIYQTIKKNRNFEEISENLKQNSNLSVIDNKDFDILRKNYKTYESICF